MAKTKIIQYFVILLIIFSLLQFSRQTESVKFKSYKDLELIDEEEIIVEKKKSSNKSKLIFFIILLTIILFIMFKIISSKSTYMKPIDSIQIKNQKFYKKLIKKENAFKSQVSPFSHSGTLTNIEKVIHRWPHQQHAHEEQYTNDSWILHQSYLIVIFEHNNYTAEQFKIYSNMKSGIYYFQYSIIRACLFIFYKYLLNKYEFLLESLNPLERSSLLHTIFIILLQSHNLNFIIKDYSDTIQSISNKLRSNILLQPEPLTVQDLKENLGNDQEYMKSYSEKDKTLIKIANKLKRNNNNWSNGIWESHPEWSKKDPNIDTIFDPYTNKLRLQNQNISLQVDDFYKKYETIYNLIYK